MSATSTPSIRDELLRVQREVRRLKMAGFRNPLGAANTAIDLLDTLIALMDGYFQLVAIASQDTAARVALLQAGADEHWGREWWETAEKGPASGGVMTPTGS